MKRKKKRISEETREKLRVAGRAAWARMQAKKNLNAAPVLAKPSDRASLGATTDGGEARESTTEKPLTVLQGTDSRGGVQTSYATIVKLYYNPRMVLCVAGIKDLKDVQHFVDGGMEVVVGDNSKLWIGCPLEVRPSEEYKGYYEVVGELPRAKGDRAYLERFPRE